MNLKTKLQDEVWRNHKYYHMAQQGSLDARHKGMQVLKKLAEGANKVLDLGCGEGTRLNLVLTKKQQGTGVDISPTAINLGRKRYPGINFVKADLEKIPLENDSFDLIYSAYVLEHLSDPEQVLKEAIRLMKKEGFLVLIAPNYGSPNRASPSYKGARVKKLLIGIARDFIRIFRKQKRLSWERVEPIANREKYDVDWDTTVEPYIGSLINYLEGQGLVVKEAFSCWSEELGEAKVHQKIFRELGEAGIYPFWMWGPHLVVVARRV